MGDPSLTLPPVLPPTTRLWVDAYSMHLEAVAEAMSSTKMRRTIEDAIRNAEADLAAETDASKVDQLNAILQNQKKILLEIGTFNLEAYRELMANWRKVRDQVMASGWNLNEEIHFEPNDALGIVKVSQGPLEKPKLFMAAEAQVMLAFLTFVSNKQDQMDPAEHTKQMLLRQGINAQNFDEHADRLCISNPWAPNAPAKRKNIIQGNFL